MSKGVQIAIAAFSVFAGVVWLIAAQSSGDGSFRYYQSIAEFRADQTGPATGGSHVHGYVVNGSIHSDLPAGFVEFMIHDTTNDTLPVRYDNIDVPDLFRDGAEVVIEGRYADGMFRADRIMAKCPSKYEAREEPGPEA